MFFILIYLNGRGCSSKGDDVPNSPQNTTQLPRKIKKTSIKLRIYESSRGDLSEHKARHTSCYFRKQD